MTVIDKNVCHKTCYINLLTNFRCAKKSVVDERLLESPDSNVVHFVVEGLPEEDSPPIHLPVTTDEQPEVCQTLNKSQSEYLRELLVTYANVLSNKPDHSDKVSVIGYKVNHYLSYSI